MNYVRSPEVLKHLEVSSSGEASLAAPCSTTLPSGVSSAFSLKRQVWGLGWARGHVGFQAKVAWGLGMFRIQGQPFRLKPGSVDVPSRFGRLILKQASPRLSARPTPWIEPLRAGCSISDVDERKYVCGTSHHQGRVGSSPILVRVTAPFQIFTRSVAPTSQQMTN